MSKYARSAALACLLLSAGNIAGAAKSQQLRDVSVSEPRATASGSWSYALRSSARSWPCDDASAGAKCLEHVVAIANNSAETLECKLRVQLVREDGSVANTFEGPALVFARTSPEVHATISDDKTRAQIDALDCWARAPYQRIAKTAGCRYDMMGKPFENYYPPEAKLQSLQGPVIVAFSLTQRYGAAADVKLAESSLVPMLDAAALKFIRDQDFRTNCPGTRFDVLMRFKLRDEVAAPPP